MNTKYFFKKAEAFLKKGHCKWGLPGGRVWGEEKMGGIVEVMAGARL